MRGIVRGLSVVIALIGLAGAGQGSLGTAAQDATPTDLANHPIVGAWLLMNPGDPPSPSPMIFSADGTF
nr:hypothetical protein [Chloroflexia bacterium]